MINLNKKIKYSILSIFGLSIFVFSVNTHKKLFTEFEIDLNSIIKEENSISKIKIEENDPFEILKGFEIDNFFLKKINIALYNPPLVNKLYPKSNLYGHELIRYFDK